MDALGRIELFMIECINFINELNHRRYRIMTQQKTNEPENRIANKGLKGHYWTEVQNIEDMRATQEDMERYYEQNQY